MPKQRGPVGRATSSKALGPNDPRWDRNARQHAAGLDLDDTLTIDNDGRRGVQFRKGQPFRVLDDGIEVLTDGLVEVKGGRLCLNVDAVKAALGLSPIVDRRGVAVEVVSTVDSSGSLTDDSPLVVTDHGHLQFTTTQATSDISDTSGGFNDGTCRARLNTLMGRLRTAKILET